MNLNEEAAPPSRRRHATPERGPRSSRTPHFPWPSGLFCFALFVLFRLSVSESVRPPASCPEAARARQESSLTSIVARARETSPYFKIKNTSAVLVFSLSLSLEKLHNPLPEHLRPRAPRADHRKPPNATSLQTKHHILAPSSPSLVAVRNRAIRVSSLCCA